MSAIEKRTAKDGSACYRVRVRLKGCSLQTASFTRLTDAKRWAQQTEAAIREGRHFKVAEAKRHTLADLVDRYSRDVLPTKPKQIKRQGQQLRWWRDQLGERTLADVTPAAIVECRDALLRTSSPATTTVRYMAALSHAFTVAVNEFGWLEDSPIRKVRKPTEPRGRTRFLDDDERGRLLAACKEGSNQSLYTVVVLALSTGMRHAEIMNLYWKRPKRPPAGAWGVVHLRERALVLYDTKNTESRRVPVTGHAFELLTALVRRVDTDLLFPSSKFADQPIDLKRPWTEAVERAGIDNFRFHDLRHSAASYLAMNDASSAEIAEVLGHKTLQMVKRYAHLSEAHTSKVVASMNAKIFGDR